MTTAAPHAMRSAHNYGTGETMPLTLETSQYLAVGASSAKFTNAMTVGVQYVFTCSTDCWVTVAVTGGSATANTANNHFVKAGARVPLAALSSTVAYVHAIRETDDGDATLSVVRAGAMI